MLHFPQRALYNRIQALGPWYARCGIARAFAVLLGYLVLLGVAVLLYSAQEATLLAQLPVA